MKIATNKFNKDATGIILVKDTMGEEVQGTRLHYGITTSILMPRPSQLSLPSWASCIYSVPGYDYEPLMRYEKMRYTFIRKVKTI